MKKILILSLALSMTHPGFSIFREIKNAGNTALRLGKNVATEAAKEAVGTVKQVNPKRVIQEGAKLAKNPIAAAATIGSFVKQPYNAAQNALIDATEAVVPGGKKLGKGMRAVNNVRNNMAQSLVNNHSIFRK